jgi:hypothetical protein
MYARAVYVQIKDKAVAGHEDVLGSRGIVPYIFNLGNRES